MMRNIASTLMGALVLVPLVAGCGSEGSGGGGGGTLMFPTCGAAQVITRNGSGTLVCKDLPSGVLSLPKCGPTEALTSDGTSLFCAARTTSTVDEASLIARLDQIDKKLIDLGTQLDGKGGGAGTKPLFVGTTDTPTVGKITFTGVDNGIPAANAQCNAKFAGSHLCSVYDMYNSVVDGKILKAGSATAKAWVYSSNWKFPMGTPTANSNATSAGGPQEGTSDNCGSYTYPTADRKWTGTAVEYAKLQTGDWGLKFHAGASSGTVGTADYIDGAPCNKKYVIACCK